MRRAVFAFVALMSVVAPRFLHGQDRGAFVPRRVLVIGAHPDDEDTQLIAWLSRGGRAATAYLSLTRGDGGQNLIGNELGEQLGVIRTEELLAARRVDGAHQFFTRAYDFGFSKTAEETFAHWPKDSLLNDVVTVIRQWRPQIIVAVFSGTPRDGHGQHQVSAILAKETYESAAADTIRFPVSKYGAPWTPLKLYRWAGFNFAEPTLRINVGEYNPKLGKSYAEIAAESRSQHKSQGFGSLQRKGPVWDQLRRESTRVNESTPATEEKSIFDGIPEPSQGRASPVDTFADVAIEAVSDRQYLALGDSARVTATVYNRSTVPIWIAPANAPIGTRTGEHPTFQIAPDSSYRWSFYVFGSAVTQPWWLATPRNGDLFSPRLPLFRDTTRWELTPEDEREKHNWITVLVGDPDHAKTAQIRTPVV